MPSSAAVQYLGASGAHTSNWLQRENRQSVDHRARAGRLSLVDERPTPTTRYNHWFNLFFYDSASQLPLTIDPLLER